MYDLVNDSEIINKLARLFQDPKTEKIFLSSTLRTSGLEGEKLLINEIRTNKDFSVRVAITSVLNYRLPKYPKYLDIRLDNNDTYSLTKNLPGNFCTYYGKVTPLVMESETSTDYLLINTRDLLASLQRMLHMNWDHSKPQLVHNDKPNILDDIDLHSAKTDHFQKYIEFYELKITQEQTEYGSMEIEEIGKHLINEDVIKALCHCLKDYSTAVRETAASSLGQIGLPESLLALNSLIESLKEEDVNVRSKVIWTIGRISKGCTDSIIQSIVECLKNNMWKVKSACLYTLSCFGNRAAKQALPLLKKLLKESPINKQAIAETMVKLGPEGEASLMKIMTIEPDSNYKLKSSICRSLALTDITSPNIDFIVETLFKAANICSSGVIRRDAIFAIRMLAERSEDNITYLKRKNLIPFYYERLTDKDKTVQRVMIVNIVCNRLY
jgi:HEAT repeat protein